MELIEENAAVLRSLGYQPGAATVVRLVDFNLVFGDEVARDSALPVLSALGFDCELSADPSDPIHPEAIARKKLNVTAEAITEAEVALNERLASFGASTDGWGFFGDTEH